MDKATGVVVIASRNTGWPDTSLTARSSSIKSLEAKHVIGSCNTLVLVSKGNPATAEGNLALTFDNWASPAPNL
eukprot:12937677-Prorocentrum_lima.AAC.1